MRIIFDWALILIGTFCMVSAYKKAFSVHAYKCRIASLIQLVIYLFNCFPILLDYLMGRPQFTTIYWWKSMGISINNDAVSIVYDIYIALAMLALHIFAVERKYKLVVRKRGRLRSSQHSTIPSKAKETGIGNFLRMFNNKPVMLAFIFSPMISILASGNFEKYIVYAMSEFRDIEVEAFSLFSMNNLILLSMFAFCVLMFRRKLRWWHYAVILIYSLSIAWISGKRYVLANMAVMYIFYYTESPGYTVKAEKRLKKAIPVAILCLVLFSVYYLINIKNSVLMSTGDFTSVYETMRADFGRDGAIKYVIEQEFFEGNPILEYRGESLLSLLLIWIPRAIWPSKPYQHFEYLTASIKGVPTAEAGAGLTPSWYEMSLANFGALGFIIGIVLIVLLCKFADNVDSEEIKSILLMLIVALLTQSLDAYIMYIAIIMIGAIFSLFTQKVRITMANRASI